MTQAISPIRVVVCGTTFGQTYLSGIAMLPGEFRLAGILARGSDFARQCAQRYRVPLYTSVDELPDEIQAACVVVRSSILGGAGTKLAMALLERGIHVLQEQPVHHEDLSQLLLAARKNQCQYQLNGFYPDIPSVAQFIEAARSVLAQRKPLFVDAACSVHVLYPLIDILGKSLGRLRPWFFTLHPADSEGLGPLTCLTGRIAGLPLTLRVQNQFDPADPDNHLHLFHQISLGTQGGTLTLLDSHGQIMWQPRMFMKRRDDGILDLSVAQASLALPASTIVDTTVAPTYNEILTRIWPQAAARALLRFHQTIQEKRQNPVMNQYLLSAAKAWVELGTELGVPHEIAAKDTLPLAIQHIIPLTPQHWKTRL
ncbi:thiazolinyl imide reductase [Advenella kashmirensis W13003]|uniref:Thiazolinyl imide reductase n=1 Tax=Advenella kashmirensis W13003 TaxID=1424334 RepID=V8QKS3_9BURK|nr:Gfo/Idh/MocA family oxidoreductase [Advenella kashmirensis]ETF00252.1 thiazolinyl imide reductase [Advenella kashmirensis W13003]